MDLLVRPAARPRTSDKAPSAQHWRCARETVLFPPENKQEGRKEGTGTAAAKQQRQGARGLERSLPRSTTGRCERAELSRGPSLPPSGLVLCPSVAVRPEWHADIRTARRAAVKQSGKREWQAGRGSRHDGRRRQRHYRRNRRGSTGSRSNRARRGNCWDKTLLG